MLLMMSLLGKHSASAIRLFAALANSGSGAPDGSDGQEPQSSAYRAVEPVSIKCKPYLPVSPNAEPVAECCSRLLSLVLAQLKSLVLALLW
jgi:hypothetical protein